MTRLSLVLHRDLETGEWFVDRVESQKNNIRTQTKFCVPYPIKVAFNPNFVEYLQEVLPQRTGPSATVFDGQKLPALAIEFNKLRVVAQRALAGLQSVTIRIQDVAGFIPSLFSPALFLDGPENNQDQPLQLTKV